MSTSVPEPAEREGRAPAAERTKPGRPVHRGHALRKRIISVVGIALLRGVLLLIPRLTHRRIAALARTINRLGLPLSRRQIASLRKNLRKAYGSALTARRESALVAAIRERATTMALELLWLQRNPTERLRWLVGVEGLEHLRQALEAGRGAILFTGHISNWMAASARIAAEGFPVTNIMRRRKDATSDRFIWQILGGIGYECIGREEGVFPLARILKRNGALGFIGDNPADPEQGARVELFGMPCYFWPTPVVLSRMTGAPILPVATSLLEDGRYRATIFPPVKPDPGGSRAEAVAEGMPLLAQWLEAQIRRAPDQWAWYYERWDDADSPQD